MTKNKMKTAGAVAAAAAFQYALSTWLARVTDHSMPAGTHADILIPEPRPAEDGTPSPQLSVGSR